MSEAQSRNTSIASAWETLNEFANSIAAPGLGEGEEFETGATRLLQFLVGGNWNKPEETAAAIKNGWVHTADCAHMDEDGLIFISDRLKDMIICGVESVYSIEVENAISTTPR